MGLIKGFGNVFRYWSGASRPKYGNFYCSKCRGRECVVSEIYVSNGFFESLVNIESKKFSVVICLCCKISEFYNCGESDIDEMFKIQSLGQGNNSMASV